MNEWIPYVPFTCEVRSKALYILLPRGCRFILYLYIYSLIWPEEVLRRERDISNADMPGICLALTSTSTWLLLTVNFWQWRKTLRIEFQSPDRDSNPCPLDLQSVFYHWTIDRIKGMLKHYLRLFLFNANKNRDNKTYLLVLLILVIYT